MIYVVYYDYSDYDSNRFENIASFSTREKAEAFKVKLLKAEEELMIEIKSLHDQYNIICSDPLFKISPIIERHLKTQELVNQGKAICILKSEELGLDGDVFHFSSYVAYYPTSTNWESFKECCSIDEIKFDI